MAASLRRGGKGGAFGAGKGDAFGAAVGRGGLRGGGGSVGEGRGGGRREKRMEEGEAGRKGKAVEMAGQKRGELKRLERT